MENMVDGYLYTGFCKPVESLIPSSNTGELLLGAIQPLILSHQPQLASSVVVDNLPDGF